MADITLGTWHGIRLGPPLTSFQVRISKSEFQQPGTVYAMMERTDQRQPANGC